MIQTVSIKKKLNQDLPGAGYIVELDGEDFADRVSGLSIELNQYSLPLLTLQMPFYNLEVDGVEMVVEEAESSE